jgi:transposase
MFIRIKPTAKPNKKKIQICESIRQGSKVKQVIVRHVGIAHNEKELESLKRLGKTLIAQIREEREGPYLFPMPPIDEILREKSHISIPQETPKDEASVEEKAESLIVDLDDLSEQRRVVEGFQDIFGYLFQSLGFNNVLTKKKNEVLKELVLARIARPASKRASQEILTADFGVDIHLDRIYRMMDSFIEKQDEFQTRVLHATQSLCFEKINMTFFDVTTLYFESTEEDELRRFGYSKDQKFHSVQVVLALATTQEGLPIGYKTFPGNTAEVSTLLNCLAEWKKKLPIGEVTVVADRAMMSETNLQSLEEAGFKYVIAAKLKKLPKNIREKICKKEGSEIGIGEDRCTLQEHMLAKNRRLIVTYNDKRARKDRKDRERVLEKVQKKIGSGKNMKKLVSNRGYQKYLKAEGEGKILVDEEKLVQEEQWDGLHGLITNDHTSQALELLQYYRRLWVIEESFRIHKTDLSIRPIYHFKPERVEAHILLCYLAFALTRYAEHRIELQKEKISIQEIRRELWRTQVSILKDHRTGNLYRVPSNPNQIVRKIYQTFGLVRNEKIRQIEKSL